MTRLPLESQCALPYTRHSTPAQPRLGVLCKRLPGFMVLGVYALRTEGDGSWTTSQLMKEMVKAQRGAVSSPRSHTARPRST